MKYYVKLWNEAFEDYEDWSEWETKEEAQQEVAILKRNGEKAIIERFAESSRDNDLSEEVEYYNNTYNR